MAGLVVQMFFSTLMSSLRMPTVNLAASILRSSMPRLLPLYKSVCSNALKSVPPTRPSLLSNPLRSVAQPSCSLVLPKRRLSCTVSPRMASPIDKFIEQYGHPIAAPVRPEYLLTMLHELRRVDKLQDSFIDRQSPVLSPNAPLILTHPPDSHP